MQNLDKLKVLVKTSAFRLEVEEVFFEAMNKGYATDASKKKSILWLPGSKVVKHERDSWKVVDLYHVTQLGPRSGGTTTVSYEGQPVWMMQYSGWYEKDAIPCLKAALRAAYKKKQFLGGRGPKMFRLRQEFFYQNFLEFGEFDGSFKGEEQVYATAGDIRGRSTYQGGMMC